ncbi:HAMP domain-containing methyl-accepting chemotaxis protein [Selenomonas sputigena]|uniref:HAMP domain-containing methyl-accepting chemotaxis protein n=1 Tax=Selenomonas sputigena TaxID=69823 RepID=A0ABV3X7X7_9FIRM
MNGLTVAKKIVLSFVILIVMFLCFGIYANYSGNALNKSTADLMDWTRALNMSSRLSDATNETRIFALLKAMAQDPQTREQLEQQHEASKKKVEDVFDEYRKTLAETTYYNEEERRSDQELFDNEYNAWLEYLKAGEEGDRLFAEGKYAEGLAFIDQKWSKSYQKLETLILSDEERAMKGADAVDKEADDVYARVVMTTVIVTILVLIIAVVCGYFLLHSIKGSVAMVLDALKKVAEGDLSLKLATDSGDEFAQMAEQCNKMLHNVRSMTKKIQDTANTVSDSSGALTSTSEQSAQATQNVAESITEVAGAAQAQLDSVAEAKHQVHAFTRGIADAAQTIEQVAADIEHTSQRAEEGNKLVLSTVDQMNAIADTVISSSNVVAKLGERSKEIGNIVEVISNISGQTNLLALNAAIEAARAGEHGRGFAVVAEEVRKLAEESQHASQKIEELIRAIQQETAQAVQAMETGREEAEKGRENVTATGKGFSEIRAMIQRVQENSAAIEKNMEDLSRRAEKIDDATGKIHDSASKVAAEAQNVSAATEEQAAGMEEIAASSRGLSDMAQDLNDAAAKFKT